MPKILLVEDNEMNREMLSRRLVRKGFEVVIAEDGLQGVAMARQEQPDLVLMDMSLPGIDGWEATRRIKADPATRVLPVIALTAHAMAGDRAQALAAGCDEFDTKPIELPRLLDKIHGLLAGRSAPPVMATVAMATTGTRARQVLASSDTTLPAVSASLPALKTALDALCEQANVSAELRADLQVVLDEVCANVIKHAYPADRPGVLRLGLCHLAAALDDPSNQPAAIEITVTDQGRPFNPLARPTPDLSLTWDDLPLGGLGIHLVRQLTNSQSYSHSESEGNRLSLVRHLT